jgi:hypothetical protein
MPAALYIRLRENKTCSEVVLLLPTRATVGFIEFFRRTYFADLRTLHLSHTFGKGNLSKLHWYHVSGSPYFPEQ